MEPGLRNLWNCYRFLVSESATVCVAVEKLRSDDSASFRIGTKDGLHIAYREPNRFFRAFSILLEHRNEVDYEHQETALFEGNILLVGEESTYRFIEAMLVTLKNTFRTRKIHIGMDEAMNLGTGNYVKKNGPHNLKCTPIVRQYGILKNNWGDFYA